MWNVTTPPPLDLPLRPLPWLPLLEDTDDADKIMVDYTLKGLYLGFVRTTQTHDSGGRAILFIDPSKLAGYNKNDENERLGVARALWYVMHNVFEGNDTVQRLGMIAL